MCLVSSSGTQGMSTPQVTYYSCSSPRSRGGGTLNLLPGGRRVVYFNPSGNSLNGLNFGFNGHSIRGKGPDIQMKLSFVISLFIAASFAVYAEQAMPRM